MQRFTKCRWDVVLSTAIDDCYTGGELNKAQVLKFNVLSLYQTTIGRF